MKVRVYVPRPGTEEEGWVLPGSALVGAGGTRRVDRTPEGGRREWFLVYYEGNLYRSSNIQTFDNKVDIAAGRAIERYPTIARAFIPDSSLFEVGSWDYARKVLELHDPKALSRWLGVELLDPLGLQLSHP